LPARNAISRVILAAVAGGCIEQLALGPLEVALMLQKHRQGILKRFLV
jgi:hypothetical protein